MEIKSHIHLILVPLAFLVMWFKDGVDAATFQIAFLVYFLAGFVVSIRILKQGVRFILDSRVTALIQLLYLAAFVVYWIVVQGINRKAILLLSPFLLGVIFSIVVRACKQLSFTKSDNKE